jgi:hypothetical protein
VSSPPAASDPVAAVAEALARARGRGLSGWHRVALAAPALLERRVRAAAGEPATVVYHLRPLEALYPYRMLAREARPGALAIVRDAAALFEPAHARWRKDPLAARVVRRVLIGSRLPTLWCAPTIESVGAELLAQAPVLATDWRGGEEPAAESAHVDPEALVEDFMVWARTGG